MAALVRCSCLVLEFEWPASIEVHKPQQIASVRRSGLDPKCSIRTNFCMNHTCNNGGHCINTDSGPKCACQLGFTGEDCSEDQDECAIFSCENGGKCVNLFGTFECLCLKGSSGKYCEKHDDFCASNPCNSRGVCLDRPLNFTCICNKGFAGTQCQIAIDYCEPNPCQNNGTCVDSSTGSVCHCSPATFGQTCAYFRSFKNIAAMSRSNASLPSNCNNPFLTFPVLIVCSFQVILRFNFLMFIPTHMYLN